MKTSLAAVLALCPLTLLAAEPPAPVPNLRLPEVTVTPPKAPVFNFTPAPVPAPPRLNPAPVPGHRVAPAPKSNIFVPKNRTAPMPIKEPDPAIDPKIIVRVPGASVAR